MTQGFECLTEPIVSIIVPVYKVEQYLVRTVSIMEIFLPVTIEIQKNSGLF